MRELWKTYRPFLTFLGVFLGVYVVLSVLYNFYIGSFAAHENQTDTFTIWVSSQTEFLLQKMGYDAFVVYDAGEAWSRLHLEGKYIARIVEGCNAISVMILFVSFIFAFKGSVKATAVYIVSGIVLIHVLNIFRIAFFCLGLRFYPEYRDIMHDLIFPLVIYGIVFVLWIVWVQKFSFHAKSA